MRRLLLLSLLCLAGCGEEPGPQPSRLTVVLDRRVGTGERVYYDGHWWRVARVSANHEGWRRYAELVPDEAPETKECPK